MEELKFFVCSICRTAYSKAEYAERCEKRGVEEVKVVVGQEYEMQVPAVTSPFSVLGQKRTVVHMFVKVEIVEGPLSHDAHRLSRWETRLANEPVFCKHFEPPHLDCQHVYHIHYRVLKLDQLDVVLPHVILLNSFGGGDCSQEHFLQYVNAKQSEKK